MKEEWFRDDGLVIRLGLKMTPSDFLAHWQLLTKFINEPGLLCRALGSVRGNRGTDPDQPPADVVMFNIKTQLDEGEMKIIRAGIKKQL